MYSRRLGERIRDEARYRRYADPAGNAPAGFRRQPEPPHLLEIDATAIEQVVELFERYARGNVSFEVLGAEYGIPAEGVRKIVMNPVYNGWAVRGRARHGRARPEERVPARWRNQPPVSDELWERVCEVRRQHARGGGPRRLDRLDPLAGLIFCACGRYLRADGFDGNRRHRRQHPDPCAAWGEQRRYPTDTWYRPLAAQVGGLRLDNATIERVIRSLRATASRPDELRRRRLERQRRELALDHAAGRIGDAHYIEAVTAVRKAEAEAPARRPAVDRIKPFNFLLAAHIDRPWLAKVPHGARDTNGLGAGPGHATSDVVGLQAACRLGLSRANTRWQPEPLV